MSMKFSSSVLIFTSQLSFHAVDVRQVKFLGLDVLLAILKEALWHRIALTRFR
jgi:hypothetical protein